MRNHISIREDRTRPGKQRQSACRAPWIVSAPCDAPSAANGRLHRQNDGSGQTPVERFLPSLNGAVAEPATRWLRSAPCEQPGASEGLEHHYASPHSRYLFIGLPGASEGASRLITRTDDLICVTSALGLAKHMVLTFCYLCAA